MNKPKINISIAPTTYGVGPFHPAIKDTTKNTIWYWHNEVYTNEADAYLVVDLKVLDVFESGSIADMNALINSWNIIKV